MALKTLFNAVKTDTIAIKAIDSFLVTLNAKDNDRMQNINSPSSAGGCSRSIYYSRTGVEQDGTLEPRTRRIFNNGDHVHDRLQEYLEKSGALLMREVPLINVSYQIQGHTDGFMKVTQDELGILEIKSINDNGFTSLKDAKDEHKAQAMIYLYCAEERRLHLRNKYINGGAFSLSTTTRSKYYASRYKHFVSGSKFTKEEKIEMQVKLGLMADTILFNTSKPITKVIFLYENKNNQELKEFVVERDDTILKTVLEQYLYINDCIDDEIIPDRICPNKSCSSARFCNYKLECFN
jgi:hypothetical protein